MSIDRNLDCYFNADELWRVGIAAERGGRKLAREWFPDRPKGYVRATRDLAHYAYNKATAMRCRAKGDVNVALSYEEICDRIYDRLPEFARW